jgi:serine/threonine-protein kinase
MRFGRYEIVERLGAGGMGEVFRARDHDLPREVAIKFLPERFASDPGRFARFTQEARAASSLNHPNIITVHDIGETSGVPYIVIEYVDGQTLRQIVQGRPLSTRRALDIAVQIADGLAKAHAAGIVHRDLKPENVMVTKDGVVKILDFGLAKPVAEQSAAQGGAPASEVETQLTAKTLAGTIVGTIGYMAPEQARGEPTDHRSDQFALGAVLYELATGRRAFHRESVVQTLVDVIEHEPEPLATLNPAFPAPARWVIERCLAKDPAERYASTLDLARELRGVRDHLGEATTSVAAGPPRRRNGAPPRFRAWQLGLTAILAVACVLLGPTLWQHMATWMVGTRLPHEMRVAVLPVGVSKAAGDVSNGLLEYVVVRLADLNRVQSRISVVPASEVLDAGVKTPSAAKKALGATVAVGIAVDRVGPDLRVSVSLSDPTQVLNGTSRTFRSADFSPEGVVDQVVGLLALQLEATDKSRWDRGGTSVPTAGRLFAQGLRETPYQQARTAAERYDQEKSLRAAIALFNKAIDIDRGYAAAFAGLGEAHLRLYRLTKRSEDLELAERTLLQARQLDDTRPSVWISLGMLYTLKGIPADAEKAFNEAIARNPAGGDAHREMGLAYQRAGQTQKAEAEYKEAIALQPDSWANHNYLAAFLVGAGRNDEAEKELRAALERAPDNARVLSNLGGLYMSLKRWGDAERELNAAVVSNPGYGPALSNLGSLQIYERRDYAKAADFFERAAVAAPRDYRIWYNLGLARFWAAGQRAGSAEPYRRAASLLEEEIAVDPGNPATLLRLADCHAMLGNATKARSLVADALKRHPGGEDLRVAASVHEQLGDRARALDLVRAALQAGVATSVIETSPSLDGLREDPQYGAIVKAVAMKQALSGR